MSSPLTNNEIAAIAVTLRACSPFEKLTDMEARPVLELMNQRGYLRRPTADHPVAIRDASESTA